MHKPAGEYLSIYGSHDSAIAIRPREGEFRVYEFERLLGKRYCMIRSEPDFAAHIRRVQRLIADEYGLTRFHKLLHNELPPDKLAIVADIFGAAQLEEVGHHHAHAACAFFQSPFERALIVSFDGGGWDHGACSFFNLYTGDRETGEIRHLQTIPLDLGNPYSLIAAPIREIRPGPDSNYHSLVYAGKVMGLAAYGVARPDWIGPMRAFYRDQDLDALGRAIGLHLDFNTIEGRPAWDLAATSQRVFEDLFIETMQPHLQAHPLPVCLTGGCALNVLLNQRLRETLGRPLYIPPNPNDCGLALGQLLLALRPRERVLATYAGFGLLDAGELPRRAREYGAAAAGPAELALLLRRGEIIGIAAGRSECGPRALGNRSILCDPSFVSMREILNEKVKFREWFRPFAPVVRLEDVSRYFDFEGEAEYMSFAPRVRAEYADLVPAVVHADGTARVQTVTRAQHPLLYDLLTEMERQGGPAMLLNTSFNIKGRPILTTIADALEVLRTTQLDRVWIEGHLFSKQSRFRAETPAASAPAAALQSSEFGERTRPQNPPDRL